jgi:hypothetical protein
MSLLTSRRVLWGRLDEGGIMEKEQIATCLGLKYLALSSREGFLSARTGRSLPGGQRGGLLRVLRKGCSYFVGT